MKLTIVSALLLLSFNCFSQVEPANNDQKLRDSLATPTTNAAATDSLLTYSKIIHADSLTKDQIFDKTLVWCSKVFNDSKSAINVSNKEAGILAGKGETDVIYKILFKKDSTYGLSYIQYWFDWLIEIKDKKLRLSLSNIKVGSGQHKYPVTSSSIAPFQSAYKLLDKNWDENSEWQFAKSTFILKVDTIAQTLSYDLHINNTDF